MLMNADEFDDDFGDPRSLRAGVAHLDLESSGEAKESKSPLDRPSRGRHARKKKMKAPSMAPPATAPPAAYGESKEEEKSGFGSAGALGESTQSRARALAKQRQIQMQRRQQALQASTMSRGATTTDGGTFTPGVAQFSAPRAQKHVDPYGAFGRSSRRATSDEPDPDWGSRKNQEKDYSARNVTREDRQFGERFAPVQGEHASPYRGRREEPEEPPRRPERVYRDDDDRYDRPVQEARRYGHDEPSPGPYEEPSPPPRDRDRDDRRRDYGRYDEEDEYFDRRREEPPRRRDYNDYDDRDRRRYDDDYERRERRRESPPPRERERRESPPPRAKERRHDDYPEDDGYDSPPRRRERADDPPPRGSPEPREPREEKPQPRRRKKERSPSPEPEYDDQQSVDRAASPASEAPSAPEFDASALDLRDMRKFLHAACPKRAGVVQCSIKRNRSGTNKLFPEYAVYMKEGDRFLMCSKKRPNNKTSNYLISMGEGDLKRNSKNYIGKLRANFAGTEFQVFDSGKNPSLIDMGGAAERSELGAVVYTANVLGSRGPRKMQAAVPKLDWDGKARAGDVLSKLKAHDYNDITYTINKPPRWNDQVRDSAWTLNERRRDGVDARQRVTVVVPRRSARTCSTSTGASRWRP
jgi:tubby-related protein 1